MVDYNFGETDDYFLMDVSAQYEIRDGTTLHLWVHNLFDEEYIVSRHPIGPRPGRDRSIMIGLVYAF